MVGDAVREVTEKSEHRGITAVTLSEIDPYRLLAEVQCDLRVSQVAQW